MSPAFLVVQMLLQYGPDAARLAKELFTKKDVTEADIDNLINHVQSVIDFDKSRNAAQAQLDAENAAR